MFRFFLCRRLIRSWLARSITEWMGKQEYYTPAAQAASVLKTWLNSSHHITCEQLKKVVLVALMHWYDLASYFGNEFTTKIGLENGLGHGFGIPLICMVYNILSETGPIKNVEDYQEEIGGFPPDQINPVDYFVNFVTGNQKLKLELAVDRLIYKVGEPIDLTLNLHNLSDKSITLKNNKGPTIEFIAVSLTTGVEERISHTINGKNENSEPIILPAESSTLIKWVTDLPQRSSYAIKSQVYIPHYDKLVNLTVGIEYGTKPLIPRMMRDFCTL